MVVQLGSLLYYDKSEAHFHHTSATDTPHPIAHKVLKYDTASCDASSIEAPLRMAFRSVSGSEKPPFPPLNLETVFSYWRLSFLTPSTPSPLPTHSPPPSLLPSFLLQGVSVSGLRVSLRPPDVACPPEGWWVLRQGQGEQAHVHIKMGPPRQDGPKLDVQVRLYI